MEFYVRVDVLTVFCTL